MQQFASIGALYASSCFHWSNICIKLLPLEHYMHHDASIGALYVSSCLHWSTICFKLLPLEKYMHHIVFIGALYASSCFHWSTISIKLLPLEELVLCVHPRSFDENECGQTLLLARGPCYSGGGWGGGGGIIPRNYFMSILLLRIRSSKDSDNMDLIYRSEEDRSLSVLSINIKMFCKSTRINIPKLQLAKVRYPKSEMLETRLEKYVGKSRNITVIYRTFRCILIYIT